MTAPATRIQTIPIDSINVLNPRVRNQKVFHDIADNIVRVGLKRPITVTPCRSGASGKDYDLVCGQGRLEAFAAVGQTEIPAIVIEATEHEALVMSLVENLARRQHRGIDLLHAMSVLQQQGYSASIIAAKTGVSVEWVTGILSLIDRGEERLLAAVEAGHVSVSFAVSIADAPEDEQRVLQELYESNQLRGKRLLKAKQLIAARRRRGKTLRGQTPSGPRSRSQTPLQTQDVMNVYRKEVNRKRVLIRKADAAGNNLIFVSESLKRLYQDSNFITLLRAEGLIDLPQSLADRVISEGRAHG
jgi:ParB family chromosome partitioning protein